MTKMTIKKRWHAIDDQLEQAIQQGDLPAITHLIEKAKWLREEDVRWADYFHFFRWTTKPVLRVPCQYTHLVAVLAKLGQISIRWKCLLPNTWASGVRVFPFSEISLSADR